MKHNDDDDITLVNQPESEFKPGNTPHLYYGKSVLNANVPWAKIVQQIVVQGYTPQTIAKQLEVDTNLVKAVAKNDTSRLNFKTGARLLSLHATLYPSRH